MSRSVQKANSVVRTEFVVYDSSDVPVTGASGFTIYLSLDGVNSVITVNISEIANGRYLVYFTPNSAGKWTLLIQHPTYNLRGWTETFDVTTDGVLIISDIWSYLLETGFSVARTLRVMASVITGRTTRLGTSFISRNLSDTTDQVTGTVDVSGRTPGSYGP